MLELTIQNELALLSVLLVSPLARGDCRDLGLEASCFSDYHLHQHGDRARYYNAIMNSQSSYIAAANWLECHGLYRKGDVGKLLSLAVNSIHVSPDYPLLINNIIADFKLRDIQLSKTTGDYSRVGKHNSTRKWGGVEI